MAAQEYYRAGYTPSPLSPPTNPGNLDHDNASDVDDGIDGGPERVHSPNSNANSDNDRFNSPSPPPHERIPSAYTDTPGYESVNRDSYGEDRSNPYDKDYNMADQESKEALVSGVRNRRSSGYQDLGAFSRLSLRFLFLPAFMLMPRVIYRVRGSESSWSGDCTFDRAWRAGKVCSVDGPQATFGATDTKQTKRYRSAEPSVRR